MSHTFWWVTLTVVVVLLYIGGLWLRAWLEVRASPKEDMWECPKHGFFRKKHLLYVLNMEVCPLCFHDANVNAERLVR